MTIAVINTFEGAVVRHIYESNFGEPVWVARDVCEVVGISKYRDAVAQLDADERVSVTVDTLGGPQQMVGVTEAGVWSLMLISRSPRVKPFKRWLTHEVLPTIRKTGGYGRPVIDGNSISRLELIEIAHNAETERLALEAENKVLAPKAEAYDAFLDATGKFSVGAVAKMLGKSQNWLFRELRNRDVLIAKGSMRNTPYQKYMHHFEVIAHEYERSGGEMGCSYTTYVQPSGIDFIRRRLGLATIDPLPSGGVS